MPSRSCRGEGVGGGADKDLSGPNRLLYVETLARINTPEAMGVLAAASIDDEIEEVRLTSLDHLQSKPRPGVVAYYVSRLRDKSRNPLVINRAAFALGRMKDPSAIRPLIDALVT